MKLTQEEKDKICRDVDEIWSIDQCGLMFTTCTTCLRPGKCVVSIVEMSCTCKECWKKKKIKEAESKRFNDSLKDFAKL